MVEEKYEVASAGPDSEVSATYNHPTTMKTSAWTGQHWNARVFCYQGGHDNRAYSQKGFRETPHRGILWAPAGSDVR